MKDEMLDNFKHCGRYDGINASYHNSDWMKKYEEIPDEPREDNQVLHDSMKVFDGQLRWNSMAVMHNINPPMLMDSVIGSLMANIYNPNLLWDYVSSDAQHMEKQVIRQMANLCGWDSSKAFGSFTFGGKSCLMYAVRIGMNRAIAGCSNCGISGKKPVVITSTENHYTVDYVCSFLGIGKENCIRIPTENDKMNIEVFEDVLVECIKNNIPIAAVIVLGGNTINNSMDSVKEVYDIVSKNKDKYSLLYMPYIHFDTVVNWPWLFFKYYDFEKNEYGFDDKVIKVLKINKDLICQVKYADSMGIDFHKMGFVPYQSSLFMIKNGKELFSINNSELEWLDEKDYGNNFTQHYTLEHSRSFAPVYGSWLALQNMGKAGFIKYIANLIQFAFCLRKGLISNGFEWINTASKGFATVFWCSYMDDITLDDLKKMPDGMIKKHNEYIYNLFEEFGSGNYSDSRYVFAFIPDYISSDEGCNIAGLRIYPMSVELTENDAEFILDDILRIKSEFDNKYQQSSAYLKSVELKSVPR